MHKSSGKGMFPYFSVSSSHSQLLFFSFWLDMNNKFCSKKQHDDCRYKLLCNFHAHSFSAPFSDFCLVWFSADYADKLMNGVKMRFGMRVFFQVSVMQMTGTITDAIVIIPITGCEWNGSENIFVPPQQRMTAQGNTRLLFVEMIRERECRVCGLQTCFLSLEQKSKRCTF